MYAGGFHEQEPGPGSPGPASRARGERLAAVPERGSGSPAQPQAPDSGRKMGMTESNGSWRRRARRVRGTWGALALACLGTASALGLRQDAIDPAADRELARAWLVGRLDAGLPGDLDAATLGWSVAALEHSAEHVEAVARLRGALAERQGPDGSFDGAPGATWRALLGLRRGGVEERAAAEHARAFLADTDPPRSIGAESDEGSLDPALAFLRNTGAADAAELAEELPEHLAAVAGGRFDRRSALRHLRADGPGAGLLAALELRADAPAVELLLGALLLDALKQPRLVTPAGSIDWPREIHRRLDALRGPDGGYGARARGEPDLSSTAAAILCLDVLEPWAQLEGSDLDAASASEPRTAARLGDDCETCHARLQPSLDHQWRESAHAAAGVGCADCHGVNHSRTFRDEGRVSAAVCGNCHAREAEEFAHSAHASAMRTLEESALYASTPPARRAACHSCHATGWRHSDGSVGSCNFCHTGHDFSAEAARRPEACTVCHTGQDYPQEEAWRLSKHGALWSASGGDEHLAPTCATCHNPGGTHDDRFGLTHGSMGVGRVREGQPAPIPMGTIGDAEFARARAAMVGACSACHSSRFAEDSLAAADRIFAEGLEHLDAGRRLLEELHAEGLLGIAADAPIELGGSQLRADPALTGAAALDRFYEMWRFHHAHAFKGAYHNSPSVTNRQSLEGLEHDLAFLRAEAARLRAAGGTSR